MKRADRSKHGEPIEVQRADRSVFARVLRQFGGRWGILIEVYIEDYFNYFKGRLAKLIFLIVLFGWVKFGGAGSVELPQSGTGSRSRARGRMLRVLGKARGQPMRGDG